MQTLGLLARIRRRSRFNMQYKAEERVAENLLKRDFKTQYRVGKRWLYLSAVKDFIQ